MVGRRARGILDFRTEMIVIHINIANAVQKGKRALVQQCDPLEDSTFLASGFLSLLEPQGQWHLSVYLL